MTSVPMTALTLVGGVAAAAPATYLAALSLSAATGEVSAPPDPAEPLRVVILVPAHDEATLIRRCLTTLQAMSYPAAHARVVVIADNCTDDTASIARECGAEVLERNDGANRGKGYALKWAMDHLLAVDGGIEAFAIVDADSVVEPGLLAGLVASARAGAKVVQADYGALVEGSDDRAHLRAAAFLLFHRVRFAGKARLSLPCSLVGNGMLLTRSVVEQYPWSAFSEVEDLEYTVVLRLGGVEPVFAPSAGLVAPVATSGSAAVVQRRRWEGGRYRVVRRYLPAVLGRMVKDRRWDLWDCAADLATPPLGVLAAMLATGAATSLGLRAARVVPSSAAVPWAVGGLGLATHVLLGLHVAGASQDTRRALRSSPQLVGAEALTRLRLIRSDGSGPGWTRTPRPGELTVPAAGQT